MALYMNGQEVSQSSGVLILGATKLINIYTIYSPVKYFIKLGTAYFPNLLSNIPITSGIIIYINTNEIINVALTVFLFIQ